MIVELWEKYDADGNGYLDRNEAKMFVKDLMGQVPDDGFFKAMIDSVFREVDDDNSGTLDKAEMEDFLKKMTEID